MNDSDGKDVSRVVRAGFWIYWSSIVSNLSGFVYWLLITKIAGSEILGLTSATIGLSAIITGFINLGILAGLQRFLGRERRRSREGFNEYFWSTFYLRLVIHLIAGSFLVLVGIAGLHVSNYTPEMFLWAGILVYLASLQLFYSYFTSILRTDMLFLSSILGNIGKILVGVALVWMGYGFVGAVIGYLLVNAAIGVVGLIHIARYYGLSFVFKLSRVIEVIKAGLASWIPNLITMLGMWVGVLAVFGASGAVSTGYYYVAFALFSVVYMIGGSVAQLLLPYLSGVEEGRGRISSRIVLFTLVLITPVVFLGILYGRIPLKLLGSEYVNASPTLSVLLVSAIPMLIVTSVTNLVYAIGDYREVLMIGLAQNLPRLILYIVIVPLYHGLGAALAFTVGSLIALPYSLHVGTRYGFHLDAMRLLYLIGIPGIVSAFLYYAGIHWILGTILLLSVYIVYARLGLLSRSDLKMIALAFVSEKRLQAYYNRFKSIIDIILAS